MPPSFPTKMILFTGITLFAGIHLLAQGCSDAGICTIGNFNNYHGEQVSGKQTSHQEVDLSYTYATHLANERFYQPQLTYRYIKKKGPIIEFRLPFNIAKSKNPPISTSGIGDLVATYNDKFLVSKYQKIGYSLGLRVSLSDASIPNMKGMGSYPMFLQKGLGTTDIIAAGNYDFWKYLSFGIGIQFPVLQYNKNIALLMDRTNDIIGKGYRRKPDALLKLTGHYPTRKFQFNLGALSIFHLADDYYNTSLGMYSIQGSKGITLNWNAEINYSINERSGISFLYAEPLKTRSNIPDGLARSKVFNIKFTRKW